MAAYDSLKSLVQQAIRTNGNNEITGQVLQNVLMAMIDELGGENGYAGVATPSTNPGAPDGKVFYFATEAGTYTHFDGATLAKGIHLLVFNGVTWSHQTLYTIDSEVTSGSNNLITSGAVYNKIINAINALDATVSKSAGADGLSLSLTETDGKVTNISGSIAPHTYDAYGAASAAQIAAATDATNKVNAVKTQILGDAASDYNTLGKLEDKIQAEASRAAAAESALNTAKANKATTLAGYGINDAYTKTEVNGLVSTPHQNYVTVSTYASLPATGSEDTIYRVSNYNGSTSQVDASVYSEYAWNGSGYTFLRVDSQIGEVFDITVYNSNTKYADLAAALGTNGANVPSSIRRGGMSVKFVQSSDNKYVQWRCIADEFTTDTNYWVISEEGNPINKPNYIRVWIDANGKFLWGIKSNGDIVFGVGVPSQIKEYILNLVETMSLEDVNDIVAFLDGFINSGVTLSELLNKKADIEKLGNATFIQATTDKDSRLLEGRKSDGTKVICGDIELDKMSMIQIGNYTYISVSTDKNGKILLGVKHDGTVFIPKLESRSIDGIIPIKVNSNNENKEVNDFTTTQGLTWNAVGTSVTQGYTRDGQAGSESITPYLYVAQVANELGLQANNYGVGATTICKNMKSGAVVDFHVLNSSIVERVCGLNGNTPYPDADIWTIEGAPNDIFYNSEIGSIYSTKEEIETVYGALKRIIEEIQGRPNNPRLILIYWAFIKYEKDNEMLAYEIEKAFIWASNYYGVPLLNLRRESGLSPYNIYRLSIGDGVHPSADGTNMYKHKIAKFISNNI